MVLKENVVTVNLLEKKNKEQKIESIEYIQPYDFIKGCTVKWMCLGQNHLNVGYVWLYTLECTVKSLDIQKDLASSLENELDKLKDILRPCELAEVLKQTSVS